MSESNRKLVDPTKTGKVIYVRWQGAADEEAFGLTITTDLMSPHYDRGDIVLCSPREPVEDGDAAMVLYLRSDNSQCNTFQFVHDRGDSFELRVADKSVGSLMINKSKVLMMARAVSRQPGDDPLPELSDTDQEIIKLITDKPGMKGDAIARLAHISPAHFRRLFTEKLKPHGFYNEDGYRPPKKK